MSDKIQERLRSRMRRRNKCIEQSCQKTTPLKPSALPSAPSEQRVRDHKRKRDGIEHPPCAEPSSKKQQLHPTASNTLEPALNLDNQYGSPVCWEDYFGAWPATSTRTRAMDDPRANKRSCTPSRSISYSQSVRMGDFPAAWTGQHEEKMREVGLFMTDYQNRATISDDCQRLCVQLRQAEYPLPEGPYYQRDRLSKILERVRFCNEARAVRDTLPVFVPSAELLHIDGQAQLGTLCEAMNAEWTQCDTLCGPRPKPDFVVGIAPSAFTAEERAKLRVSHTSACPNRFPENMYFPFLICEVKGSNRSIQEAERQAMHGASIALRGLLQLYRHASAGAEVDRKILVFSVAHDSAMIKIFGHFATVEGDRFTFFRHQLYLGNFAASLASDEWTRPYQITRAIYDLFAAQHLARIRDVLARTRAPMLASSLTYSFGLDEDSRDSRESLPSRSSAAQEDGRSKRPSTPSTAKLQRERNKLLDLLREQQAETTRLREALQEQAEQQREEARQHKAMMERLMEQ